MTFSLEALGLVIREHRVALELTQDDLGATAGYQAGAGVSISRIESGLTRPSRGRFEGIALALQLTPEQLESEASQRTLVLEKVGHAGAASTESVKDRVKRIQREVEKRTTLITELGDAFNQAHDRARDQFFMPFVEIASEVNGAPQPDPAGLQVEEPADGEAEARYCLRLHSYGVAQALAGSVGGAVTGAALGGAAAYGTFIAAATFGTASTGAAISGLSGVARTNAALAMLGGGTLAAGGAGVAGGAALLTGIVATPMLLLAAGGVLWMVKRNRQQQLQLIEKLNEADAQIAATRRGFEALVAILPHATETLDYIAVHGGHALRRWEAQLGPRPLEWEAMTAEDQQQYQRFIDISASQLSIVTINVQSLMAMRGREREAQIELIDEVLSQSRSAVEALV
jgi:hypothetical protein